MMKTLMLGAIGAAALALPGAAAAQATYAQSYYAQGYGQQSYAQPSYQQSRGDYQGRRGRFTGYPQFRGVEQHIRSEVMEGVREDLIQRDDARDLMGQLRDIQVREAREYRVHGWRLPQDDQERIRADLEQLDQLVDQTRQEP